MPLQSKAPITLVKSIFQGILNRLQDTDITHWQSSNPCDFKSFPCLSFLPGWCAIFNSKLQEDSERRPSIFEANPLTLVPSFLDRAIFRFLSEIIYKLYVKVCILILFFEDAFSRVFFVIQSNGEFCLSLLIESFLLEPSARAESSSFITVWYFFLSFFGRHRLFNPLASWPSLYNSKHLRTSSIPENIEDCKILIVKNFAFLQFINDGDLKKRLDSY